MSEEFRKKFKDGYTKEDVKEWCKRPGKADKEGKPLYFTEQNHKKECDVNLIIKKYDRDGLITHVSRFKGQFGDMTANDFTDMQNKIRSAVNMFNDLPSETRNRFDNSPAELLRFMENPDNRDKAIEYGIINRDWTEESDGIGEEIPATGHENKEPKEQDVSTKT